MLKMPALAMPRPLGRDLLLPLLALGVALALSSSRIVAAPGFEFYLGPLFYLPACRWFGLRAGIVTAIVTMAPSILWWGHPVSVMLAVGHVIAVDHCTRRYHSLSTITFFYQLTFGLAVALMLVRFHFDTPIEITLVVVLRKLLCEVLLATIADILLLFVTYDRVRGRLARVRLLSLQGALDALVSIAVVGAATMFLLGELTHIRDRLSLHEHEIEVAVAQSNIAVSGPSQTPRMMRLPGIDQPLPVLVVPAGQAVAAATRLGCTRIDRGEAGPDDRDTFVYWLRMCLVTPTAGGAVAVISPQAHVRALFADIIRGVMPLIVYLVIAQVAMLAFRRAMGRSLRLWRQALTEFERQQALSLAPAPFAETDAILQAFVAANNDYIAVERERLRLSRAVEELRATIDLKVFNDVSFDPERSSLSFTKINPEHGAYRVSLPVHSGDAGMFQSLAGREDIMVEFRQDWHGEDNWYLLLAHDHDPASGSWRYGCMIRLRAAKAFQDQMRHNARLMELGGMASALSHELRQPLFTISLAAENGRLMLDGDDAASARVGPKFDRIIEQVERATAIVQRTSSYARADRDERSPTSLAQVVHDAARFMRPVMTERSIHLHTNLPDRVPTLSLPRVGVEQILVNALQNAADSIDAAREDGNDAAGRIDIEIRRVENHLRLTVRDDGAGIDADIGARAFDAFRTSKPSGKGTGLGLFVCRQIMDEVGGAIALADNADGAGATLTLDFPLTAIVT